MQSNKFKTDFNETRKEIITGFFEIENILNENNGNGKLIALASRPGMGKTTFLHHLLSRMVSLNESNVLLFSLEMSKEQVTKRLKRNDWLTDKDFDRIHIDDTPKIDMTSGKSCTLAITITIAMVVTAIIHIQAITVLNVF